MLGSEHNALMGTLVPCYFVSTHPIGWKCSDCGRVFPVAQDVSRQPSHPSPEILRAFRTHFCEVATRENPSKAG